ncbi:MAG: hypothetical protein K2X31_05590 [Sphingopyxis sp.]|nr:hypothetical protein [Sphingopyxis sp.]
MMALAKWLGVTPLVAKLLVAVLGAALLGGGFALWLNGRESSAVAKHEGVIEAKVQRQGRAADQNMAGRLIVRAEEARAARQEFDDATASWADEGLTRRQRLDVCIELRDAGTDTTLIPECGDLHSGAQAGAVRTDPTRQ